MTVVRQTNSHRMGDSRAVPATATRPAVSRTDNHQAVAAGEGMATVIHPAQETGARLTGMVRRVEAMVILQAQNAKIPCIHTSPLVMGGIGYRMTRLTRTTATRWIITGIL